MHKSNEYIEKGINISNDYRGYGIADSAVEFVFLFVLIATLFYPYSFNTILPSALLQTLKIIASLLSLALIAYYIKYERMDMMIFALVSYFFFMLIPNFLYDGYLGSVIFLSPDIPIVRTLGMCVLITIIIQSNSSKFCKILLSYFVVLITLNLVTIIIFPEGMYSTFHEENYLLGYDNTHCVVYYLALCISIVYDRLQSAEMKVSNLTWYLIAVINVSVILCKSSTSIVQVALFDILFIFANVLNRIKVYNAKIVVCFNFLFSLYLTTVFAHKGNSLVAFVAETVLHKDATFTDRTRIWDSAVYYIKQRWLFGYGCDGEVAVRLGGFSHAHNQYLTDFYYGGILLLAAFIIVIVITARKVDDYNTDGIYPYLVAVLFATMLHWNVESMHLPLQLATLTVIYNVGYVVSRNQDYRRKLI